MKKDIKLNKKITVNKNYIFDQIDIELAGLRKVNEVESIDVYWSAMREYLTQDVVNREHLPIQNKNNVLWTQKRGWVYRGYKLNIIDDTSIWYKIKEFCRYWRG